MKAYLANGLFSQADFLYNQLIAERLREEFPDLQLYVPQENEAINDKTAYANSVTISRGDDEYLLETSFMVAVIDGVAIDEGVSCEIGKYAGFDMAYQLFTGAQPRPIFALFTDIRQQGRDNMEKVHALVKDPVENQFPYRNLYVIGTIKDTDGKVVPNIEELIESIRKYISNKEE
jgi:hypothetical protein